MCFQANRPRHDPDQVGILCTLMVLIFIIGVMLYTAVRVDATNGGSLFIVIAAMIGGYMAMNIGANDVANNVGPLAAIVEVVGSGAGEITAAAPIPLWVMVVGALGIAIGLGLFGPKVIRTVGSEITELDQMRAYCIAMAATLTVILASQLGLPVSTTHVAVGAVFGVGFLREYLAPMLFLTIKGMLRG